MGVAKHSPQSMRVWPGLRLIGAGGKIPKGVFVAVAEVEPDGVRLDNGMRLKNQELLRATRPSHAVTYASCQRVTLHNRVGVCFASNTDLELWTEEVEQGVIDNMIIFQKPFPGAARTELESQLQRAVKVSAKGKRVKCKSALFWDPAGNRVPRSAEFARRRGRPGTCG